MTTTIAQRLTVLDEVSLRPVEYVFVYASTGSVSATSDADGIVDLSGFKPGDSLVVQHQAYHSLVFFYDDGQVDFIVSLVERAINLEEFVFSVNRSNQDTRNLPNRVGTVSVKEIEFSNSPTVADILATTGEVFIQKSQLGGGSPMIRGFAANRVLLNVDGVRLNNAIYRSGNLQNIISLDANNIQKMEVIFGPGSVIYGSDAIGGVVNIFTLKPKMTDTKVFKTEGKALLRYSSAANEKTGHADISIANNTVGFRTSLTYSDYDDLRMGKSGHPDYTRQQFAGRINNEDVMLINEAPDIQRFTGYSQINFNQKVTLRPSSYWQFDLDFQYSALSEVPRYDRLTQFAGDTLKYAEWYYGPQKWTAGSIGVRYQGEQYLFDEASFKLSYQLAEESRHSRDFGNPVLISRTEAVSIFNINIDLIKQVKEQHHLYYGLSSGFNHVSSTGRQIDIVSTQSSRSASRYPDGSTLNNVAAYLNYEFQPNGPFSYLAGVRYSQYFLSATMDTTFYKFPFQEVILNNGALTGGFGLVFRPTDQWILNANLTSGFRMPNIDDAAKVFDSEPGNVVVPNPDLTPEYAYNLDLGVKKIIGEQIQIDLSGFVTYLDQAMVRRDFSYNGQDSILYDGELSRVQAVVNAGSAIVYGFNLNINAELSKKLNLTSALNYTRGEDNEKLPLRHVAPVFGSTHLMYHSNKLKIDLYSDYNGRITNRYLAPSEQNKPHIYASDEQGNPYSPGWITLNLKGSYQFDPVIGLSLGVENIFDIRYRPYSSGLVFPGRNIVVALRANF
jgi:hemoglobin/transferrin/lactoferrin receptor protein